MHAGQDVLVGGHGEGGGGVSEAFGDDLDGDAGFEEQGGVGVAEVVQSDAGKPGGADLALEGVGDQLRVNGSSVGLGEDVGVGVVGIEAGVFGDAVGLPVAQDLDGGGVEVDAAPGGAGLAA